MKARHKDTGEIIELAEEGIISRDGRRFCWYQVELIPEPIDECKPSLPSNLDEAALKELQVYLPQGNGPDGICYFIAPQMLAMYKAGAELMAGQSQKIDGDLEKEAEAYWKAQGGGSHAQWDKFRAVVKHFTNWQKEHIIEGL